MDLMSTVQLLGNLEEFLGAIVVVITLLYLAVQVRQDELPSTPTLRRCRNNGGWRLLRRIKIAHS
jgi:hypothetical protein